MDFFGDLLIASRSRSLSSLAVHSRSWRLMCRPVRAMRSRTRSDDDGRTNGCAASCGAFSRLRIAVGCLARRVARYRAGEFNPAWTWLRSCRVPGLNSGTPRAWRQFWTTFRHTPSETNGLHRFHFHRADQVSAENDGACSITPRPRNQTVRPGRRNLQIPRISQRRRLLRGTLGGA